MRLWDLKWSDVLTWHFLQVTFHVKTETVGENPKVIDDSRNWKNPVDLLWGKKFKLKVWEACIRTMVPGETATFTIDKSVSWFYFFSFVEFLVYNSVSQTGRGDKRDAEGGGICQKLQFYIRKWYTHMWKSNCILIILAWYICGKQYISHPYPNLQFYFSLLVVCAFPVPVTCFSTSVSISKYCNIQYWKQGQNRLCIESGLSCGLSSLMLRITDLVKKKLQHPSHSC